MAKFKEKHTRLLSSTQVNYTCDIAYYCLDTGYMYVCAYSFALCYTAEWSHVAKIGISHSANQL